MSNPTSNFNWQMPTPTDLVTDLPADFEVFGQAVDSSMADLLGGTTGQILAKNSNTNMDFVWITNDVGDITAVNAGTGISGGGTSGAVTITNSMATEISAKGDLIVGTGSQTFDNLTAGANETRLVADSTQTTGLKWVADTTNYAIAAKGNLLAGTAADTVAALTVGANGTVLTADSAEATGMKWAASASGGITLLSTTSFSGSSITISSINQTYRDLIIEFANVTATADYTYRWRPNGNDDASNINAVRSMNTTVVNYAIGNGSNWMIDNTYTFLSNSTTNKVTLTIYDYASTTSYKNYTLVGSAKRNNDQWMSTNEIGTIQFNDAFSSIGILSGQTFNGGTIKIYGVK